MNGRKQNGERENVKNESERIFVNKRERKRRNGNG